VSRRGHTYPLRLGDEEAADLERRAEERGIAKADVIREAMGWAPVGLIRREADTPTPPEKISAPPAPPTTTGTSAGDADDGPAARGLSVLRERIERRRADAAT
jgi:hypothetical protein